MGVLDKCFSKALHEINFSFREYIKLHYLKCENKWNEEVRRCLENEDAPDTRMYASGKSLRMGEWDWDPWAALTHFPTPGQATVLTLPTLCPSRVCHHPQNTVLSPDLCPHFLRFLSPTCFSFCLCTDGSSERPDTGKAAHLL